VVQENDEGVEVVKSSKHSCTVSNKRPSKNANKPLLYGRFVKASSKTLESVAPDSDDNSDSERDFSHLCAEEKLFQACGGRTAHKAARHGLGLNGKLQRVEEQEKLAVTVDRFKSNSTPAGPACPNMDVKTSLVEAEQEMKEKENNKKPKSSKKEKGKKKRKRKNEDLQTNNEQECQDKNASSETDSDRKRVKKKKKRKKVKA